jgi:hypothetical protein
MSWMPIIQSRGERGERMALRMGFSTATADAIKCIDEHWDGSGPDGRMEHEIPLFSRITLLAQTVDAFVTQRGVPLAMRMTRERSGEWFDPDLVELFVRLVGDGSRPLLSRHIDVAIAAPAETSEPARKARGARTATTRTQPKGSIGTKAASARTKAESNGTKLAPNGTQAATKATKRGVVGAEPTGSSPRQRARVATRRTAGPASA